MGSGTKSRLLPLSFLAAVLLLAACKPAAPGAGASCQEREAALCEDFENLGGDLDASPLLHSSLRSSWWVTADDDLGYLFPDFPAAGRSRSNLILVGNGEYGSPENSLLYTAEINLAGAENASLSYSLIYRTEEHWDGLVIFAITGGLDGIDDGSRWLVLTPDNGYPDTVLINGRFYPGYSGLRTTWSQERIDLETVLGEKVILAFYFSSDQYLEDWGAAVDDIYLMASSNLQIREPGSSLDLAQISLDLPGQEFLPPDIPRANLIADASCEGSQSGLRNGERVYVKGLNESGSRALVLHPDYGQFCWVSLENAWIDGEMGSLARISDLKPEDFYLPICPASYTPILTGLDCPPLTAEAGLYPYQIESAGVQGGLITQVALIPTGSQEKDPDLLPLETRIRLEKADLGAGRDSPPGGSLWAEIGMDKVPCYLDLAQQGRVICEGLSADAAGPLEIDLCWQGLGAEQACPPGFGLLPAGGCLPLAGLIDCVPACSPGYGFSPDSGLCQLDSSPGGISADPTYCPEGLGVIDPAGCCASMAGDYQGVCPQGYYYHPAQASCLAQPAAGQACPAGLIPDPETGSCVPARAEIPPLCTAIREVFPVYEVSVRESTRCYKSPANQEELISSLKPFSVVELLGVGEDGQTLVVTNPDYQVPCWAPASDFYLADVDLSILPVIKSP